MNTACFYSAWSIDYVGWPLTSKNPPVLTYLHVCVCVHYVQLYLCLYTYTYTYIFKYTYTYMYIYVNIYKYLYIHLLLHKYTSSRNETESDESIPFKWPVCVFRFFSICDRRCLFCNMDGKAAQSRRIDWRIIHFVFCFLLAFCFNGEYNGCKEKYLFASLNRQLSRITWTKALERYNWRQKPSNPTFNIYNIYTI